MPPSPPFVDLVNDVLWAAVAALLVASTLLSRSTSRIQKQINEQLAAHRREHEQLAAAITDGRPSPNLDWRCPACGVRGAGYVPPEIEFEWACPICGVQVEITRRSADVS